MMEDNNQRTITSESYAQSTGPAAIIAPPTSKYAVEETPLSQQSELLYSPQLRFPSVRLVPFPPFLYFSLCVHALINAFVLKYSKWTDKGFAMLFFLQLIILVVIYISGGKAREEFFEQRGHFPPPPPQGPTNSSSNPNPPGPPKDRPDSLKDHSDRPDPGKDQPDRPEANDDPDHDDKEDDDRKDRNRDPRRNDGGSNSTEPGRGRRRSCLTNQDSEVVMIQIIFIILLSLIFSIALLKLVRSRSLIDDIPLLFANEASLKLRLRNNPVGSIFSWDLLSSLALLELLSSSAQHILLPWQS